MEARAYLDSFRSTNDALLDRFAGTVAEQEDAYLENVNAATLAVETVLYSLYNRRLFDYLHSEEEAGHALQGIVRSELTFNGEVDLFAGRIAMAQLLEDDSASKEQYAAELREDQKRFGAILHNNDLYVLKEYGVFMSSVLRKGKAADYQQRAEGIRHALRTTRLLRARELGPAQGEMTVTRKVVDQKQCGFDTHFTNQKRFPRWLQESTDWQDTLSNLGARLTESDTLFALQEWVIERGLPVIPILAPYSTEQGMQKNKHEAGNLHADILLLDMTCAEVYPVQVKNSRSSFRKLSKYHPDIAIITPQDLGMVTSSPETLTNAEGRAVTGRSVETSHGGLMERWRRTYGTKQRNKRKEKELRDRMQHAFGSFDVQLLPRLHAANPKHPKKAA